MSENASEDLSNITVCCRVCGTPRYDVEGEEWGVVVNIKDFPEVTLDQACDVRFCSLDCFREWIDGEPEMIYGDDE